MQFLHAFLYLLLTKQWKFPFSFQNLSFETLSRKVLQIVSSTGEFGLHVI